MKTSIIKLTKKTLPIIFWILIWHALAVKLNQEILLVTPASVLVKLIEIIQEKYFWFSILFSFIKIISGFLSAYILGFILSIISYKYKWMKSLLSPLVITIKTIPIASFIILLLIWTSAQNISFAISFLIVFPIIYSNILIGLESIDKKLIEMSFVFKVSTYKKIRYIFLSQIIPHIKSSTSIALGLCWKAGVAAEVIGIPKNSIGEHLYNAKIYLDTSSLMAWTIMIIFISIIFEKFFNIITSAIIDILLGN